MIKKGLVRTLFVLFVFLGSNIPFSAVAENGGSINCLEDQDCPGSACAGGACDQATGSCYLVPFGSSFECRGSGGNCDLAEFCDGVGIECPSDIKSTAMCRPSAGPCDVSESCDGLSVECPQDVLISGVECSPAGNCEFASMCEGTSALCPANVIAPDETPCDDSLFCTEADSCVSGQCSGTPVDCSANDIDAVQTCDYVPDNYQPTWDFRNSYVSSCIEMPVGYACSFGDTSVSHECSVDLCNAQCDELNSCPDSSCELVYSDYCSLKMLVEYDSDMVKDTTTVFNSVPNDCLDCTCSANVADCSPPQTSTYCVAGVCGAQCASDEGCVNWCDENGHTLWRGECTNQCDCVYNSLVDCDAWDGWQDVDQGIWVSDGQCREKKQVLQNLQETYCPIGGNNCMADILDSRLVDTGETRPLADYTACDDGLYCTVSDYCYAGECVSTSRDCSANSLLINSCDYEPDGISATLDHYSFTSACDEALDACASTPDVFEITHSCNIDMCGAECEESSDCDSYCDGNTYFYAGACTGCSCSYSSKVCVGDGWYPAGITRWVSTGQCTEKEEVAYENRDYYCSPGGCLFNVTETRWDDTGNMRQKSDGTSCNDGLFCTSGDSCSAGVCQTGSDATDCSDSVSCTLDFCDEESDTCTHSPSHEACDDGVFCNGVESCSMTGCEEGLPALDCTGFDLPEISACNGDPDNNDLTLDFAERFVSYCDEQAMACTFGLQSVSHTCDIDACFAECVADTDCDDSNPNTLDYCDSCLCQHEVVCGNSVLDFPEQCELPATENNSYCQQSTIDCFGFKTGARDSFGNCDSSCGCVMDDFSYACVAGSCGADCESAADCPGQCVDDVWMHDSSCSDTCECSYVEEDCNQYDRWYDSGLSDWFPATECTEKEMIFQVYRDYSCGMDGCDYVVTAPITDSLSEDESRTYQMLGFDYLVEVVSLEEASAIFRVNGQLTSQLSEDDGFVLADGSQIWVVTILSQNFAGGTLLVEFVLVAPDSWLETGNTRNLADGLSCEDSDLCTLSDQCISGLCVPGTQKECADSFGCTVDSCESLTGECLHTPDNSVCDDSIFCNGNEYCDISVGCLSSSPVDCSYLDLPEIAMCDNDPDLNDMTWDYALAVSSTCDEDLNECTRGIYQYSHACMVGCAGAECDTNNACADSSCSESYLDYCDQKSLMEYDNDSILDSTTVENSAANSCDGCLCSDNQASCAAPLLSQKCVARVCGAECGADDDCQAYCDGSVRFFGSTCSDACECQFISEDCDELDGYYETGSLQWVSTGECTAKEQKEEELRDYSCAPESCNYVVLGSQWVDTGIESSKPDFTPCDDGLFCSVDDSCVSGVCVGAARECSDFDLEGVAQCDYSTDGNDWTLDTAFGFTSVCDEDADECTASAYEFDHACSIGLCGAECEIDADCAYTDCDFLDGCEFGTYFDYSDALNSCTPGCSCTMNTCADFKTVVTDADSDGYDTECDGDCNDSDSAVYPAANELCDGKDNDCDGVIDNFGQECSARFQGVCAVGQESCSAGSWSGCPLPQFEVCDDRLDNDCDGVVDNGCRVLTVSSPQSIVYNDRILPVAVFSSGRSDMYYSLDQSGWRLLCRNCNSYDKPMSFRYGSHILSFRAAYPDGIVRNATVWFVVARPDSLTVNSATWTGFTDQNGVYPVAQIHIVETKNFRKPVLSSWSGPVKEDFMSSTAKLSVKNLPSISAGDEYVLWVFNSQTNVFKRIGVLSLNKRQGSANPYSTGIIGYLSTQGMYENLLSDFDGALIEKQPKGYSMPYPLGDSIMHFNSEAPKNFLPDGSVCAADTQCESGLCDSQASACESIV